MDTDLKYETSVPINPVCGQNSSILKYFFFRKIAVELLTASEPATLGSALCLHRCNRVHWLSDDSQNHRDR